MRLRRGAAASAGVGPTQVRDYCPVDETGRHTEGARRGHAPDEFERAGVHWHLQRQRKCHRVLKLARTIADLAGSERIQPAHIAEAIHLRSAETDGVGCGIISTHTANGGAMAVRDLDTEWVRVQAYRCMTPAERMDIAARMYEDAAALVRSSILSRNPDISPADLEYEVRRRMLPRGLAELTEPARRAHGRHGT